MTSASWFLMLVVAVHAFVFHVLPRLSRPDILFAVTVSEAFVAGEGRRLVFRYRTIVWIGAAAALAISLLLSATRPDSVWQALPVAGNVVVASTAWYLAHRKARAHAVPPSDVRVASLVPRDSSLPGGALFAAGPFAILLAAALVVYTYRGDGPDGADASNPFGLLELAAVQVAIMLTIAVTMVGRSRQIAVDGPAAAAEQRFRRVNALVPVLVGYLGAIAMSAMTVASMPAFANTLGGVVWYLPQLAFMLFGLGVASWMFRVGQGGQRAVSPAARRDVHGDATPDHAWRVGGMYYVNANDPAMWVENRVGLGYTLNLGNWRAWLLIVGMILAFMVVSRLVF
jgi:uncharacterized membrane protein